MSPLGRAHICLCLCAPGTTQQHAFPQQVMSKSQTPGLALQEPFPEAQGSLGVYLNSLA